MAIRVLIVDDSFFFCQMVGKLLNAQAEIEIVGVAHTGMEAVQKSQLLQPDVITLDVEMPIMDGITALKEIKKVAPKSKVLMFSSLTYEGAKLTLDALEFGAEDFLLKSYEDVSRSNSRTGRQLIDKVTALGRSISAATPAQQPVTQAAKTQATQPVAQPVDTQSTKPATPTPRPQVRRLEPGQFKLLVIGSSTGGPVALQQILTRLPMNFPLPIVVAQHMPEAFTGAFAERLNSLCQVQVKEAQHGDVLRPGVVYIAPGGKQLMIDGNDRQCRIKIHESDPRLNYQPCVDVTFASAAKALKSQVLALVLTGMGADGREGARLLKNHGAQVWAQDEATSVIYGMPMAVAKAGLADRQLALNEFAGALTKEVR